MRAISLFARRRKQRAPQTVSYVVDYSVARQRAIAWLGDRYLLAKPVNRKNAAPKEHNS